MSIHRMEQSPTATLAEADEALYRAKGAGRDCWRAHPSVPEGLARAEDKSKL